MSDKSDGQYWFNTKTGQVETSGDKSSWTHLMGPYPTREEAQQALETAQDRTEGWDADDDDWRRG